MVLTKDKKKSTNIAPKDQYKHIRLFTFLAGVLFLLIGVKALFSNDAPGAILNSMAGLLFLMASYTYFRKKKELEKRVK
ncbi:MAG TPA: hypothetical protein PLU96_02205 [Methanofastidiosum sp.]|jgi:uncharacterized membrane protein HdeD (DUF308 family)|nr:hypothetical protein [Methanofastidiosum sp.]HQF89368.1 hypothetical protein [Methanofastidiosum sp.]HQG60879.1 hypothetical protein [Methanofastidiosum sp.]HQK85409.1 hypothetical protein [Methanofastidiosum sp.]